MIGDVLMSGVDEQGSIPVCPICESIPDFWVLYANVDGSAINGWYWLNSDEYLKKHPHDNKLICMPNRDKIMPTLDEIMCVCHSSGRELHKFISEDLTFQKVLRAARRSKK